MVPRPPTTYPDSRSEMLAPPAHTINLTVRCILHLVSCIFVGVWAKKSVTGYPVTLSSR